MKNLKRIEKKRKDEKMFELFIFDIKMEFFLFGQQEQKTQEHCFERLSFKTLRKRYNTKQDKHNSSFVLQIEKRKEYRSFLIRLLFNLFRF
jgi:hypothetical protein